MEVPRLGVNLELQLPAYTTVIAMSDPSHICSLHHSSLQCWIPNPLSEGRGLNWHPHGFVTAEPQWELPVFHSFYCRLILHYMLHHIFFLILSSADGHLGYFHFLALMTLLWVSVPHDFLNLIPVRASLSPTHFVSAGHVFNILRQPF